MRTSTHRNGYVMVLFAMLLFGLFAIAALVIDLGFARLAQRQMQSAADSAALEGLHGEGGATLTYLQRQERAEQIIAWTFDDDLDSSNGGAGTLGAGPIVDFSGGAGSVNLNASQLMTVAPNNRTYKPALLRQPETPGQFSVHLQRGDNDADANLNSQGPAVPFLFARGSLIDRQLIGNGITVRASATATLAPVVCVGNENLSAGIRGTLNLAVPLADWIAGSGTTFHPYSFHAIGGQVDSASPPVQPPDGIGYVAIYDPAAGDRVIGFGPASIVNEIFNSAAPFAPPNASATFCYSLESNGTTDELVFERRNANRDVLFQLPVTAR